MGQVIISPNIKKESARINVQGDEINPKTKEVLVPKEKEYVPTPEDLKKPEVRVQVPQGKAGPPENPLAEMIKKQVNAAVQEAIKDIDISKMVSDAIKEAFKS